MFNLEQGHQLFQSIILNLLNYVSSKEYLSILLRLQPLFTFSFFMLNPKFITCFLTKNNLYLPHYLSLEIFSKFCSLEILLKVYYVHISSHITLGL